MILLVWISFHTLCMCFLKLLPIGRGSWFSLFTTVVVWLFQWAWEKNKTARASRTNFFYHLISGVLLCRRQSCSSWSSPSPARKSSPHCMMVSTKRTSCSDSTRRNQAPTARSVLTQRKIKRKAANIYKPFAYFPLVWLSSASVCVFVCRLYRRYQTVSGCCLLRENAATRLWGTVSTKECNKDN